MEGVEEIAEYVADEKLAQLKETINNLAEWSDEFTNRLNKIEKNMNSSITDVKTLSK